VTGSMTIRYRRGGDREVLSPATVDLRELGVNPTLEPRFSRLRY